METAARKLSGFIKRNIVSIAFSVFLGCAIGATLLLLMTSQISGLLDGYQGILLFLIILSLDIIAAIVLSKPTARIIPRWINNFKLPTVPFTSVEGIIISGLSAIITMSVFLPFQVLSPPRLINFLAFSIITFIFITTLICVALIRHYSAKNIATKTDDGFNNDLFDVPITHKNQDCLHRFTFARDLAKVIKEMPKMPSPYVIGLYGRWGEGKTSVLNLVREELDYDHEELDYDHGLIRIDYNPWIYEKDRARLVGFYDAIENGINEHYYISNLRRMLIKYQGLLWSGLRKIGIPFRVDFEVETVEEIQVRLGELVSSIDKTLVMFIDDIDRLQANEILEVFKLVNLQSKLPRIVFVLAFDDSVVKQILNDQVNVSSAYLEKVIQAPVTLPPASLADIDAYLYFSDPSKNRTSLIEDLLVSLGLKDYQIKEFAKEFEPIYRGQIRTLVRTLRQAKRYYNAVTLRLPVVLGEVNLVDFFILEAIRLFYPMMFDDIWSNRWMYLPPWSFDVLWENPVRLMSEEKQKNKTIKDHVDQVLRRETANKDIALAFLRYLFFQIDNVYGSTTANYQSMSTEFRDKQRLTHPEAFDKYFTLMVPEGELSDVDAFSEFEVWNSCFKETPSLLSSAFTKSFDKYISEGQIDSFFQRIQSSYARIDRPVLMELIVFLIKFSGELQAKRKSQLRFDPQRPKYLALTLAERGLSKAASRSVVYRLIDVASSVDALWVPLVIFGSNSFLSLRTIIDESKLRSRVLAKLKMKYLSIPKNMFIEDDDRAVTIITGWSKLAKNQKPLREYVLKLIEKHPEYLWRIIEGYVEKWSDGRWKIKLAELTKLIKEDQIVTLIKKNSSRVSVTADQKKSVTLFKRAIKERDTLNRVKS